MMTIVDTSIWIDHFQKSNSKLQERLENSEVLMHSSVLTELSLGHLKNRIELLGFLKLLPLAIEASFDETTRMIEKNKLFGMGLGAIEVQILAAAKLSDAQIFTRDQGMLRAAKMLKVVSVA
jgi:predicted nucleic acid-binding protein